MLKKNLNTVNFSIISLEFYFSLVKLSRELSSEIITIPIIGLKKCI
jgi:hypothetical protein